MTTNTVVREAQSQAEYNPLAKQKAAAKLSRIPIKVEHGEALKKPDWIRVKAGSPTTRFYEIKDILRANKLHTVCEEASCPNIGECFGKGTATFMIMGDKCTRRCPFCDVGHGRPDPLDTNEPLNLAKTIDRKSTRLNSSHLVISYAVFCLKKKTRLVLEPGFLLSSSLLAIDGDIQYLIKARGVDTMLCFMTMWMNEPTNSQHIVKAPRAC